MSISFWKRNNKNLNPTLMLPINLFFSYSSQLRPLQLHATWPQCCSQLQLQLPLPSPLHCFFCPAGTKNRHSVICWYSTIPGCMVVDRMSRSIKIGPNLVVWCRRYFFGDEVDSWVKMYLFSSCLYRPPSHMIKPFFSSMQSWLSGVNLTLVGTEPGLHKFT